MLVAIIAMLFVWSPRAIALHAYNDLGMRPILEVFGCEAHQLDNVEPKVYAFCKMMQHFVKFATMTIRRIVVYFE